MKHYILNLLYALSHLLNSLLGGSHKHSFSARVGYASFRLHKPWAKVAERIIDSVLGDYHCYESYINLKDTFYDY